MDLCLLDVTTVQLLSSVALVLFVILNKNGFNGLFNYINDLIYVDLSSTIDQAFQFFFQKLLQDLGLNIRVKSCFLQPLKILIWVYRYYVIRTLSVPAEKLQEIVSICKNWKTKTYFSKMPLQFCLITLVYH